MWIGEEVLKRIINVLQKVNMEMIEFGMKEMIETVSTGLIRVVMVNRVMIVIGTFMNMIVVKSEDIGADLDPDQGAGPRNAQDLVHALFPEGTVMIVIVVKSEDTGMDLDPNLLAGLGQGVGFQSMVVHGHRMGAHLRFHSLSLHGSK